MIYFLTVLILRSHQASGVLHIQGDQASWINLYPMVGSSQKKETARPSKATQSSSQVRTCIREQWLNLAWEWGLEARAQGVLPNLADEDVNKKAIRPGEGHFLSYWKITMLISLSLNKDAGYLSQLSSLSPTNTIFKTWSVFSSCHSQSPGLPQPSTFYTGAAVELLLLCFLKKERRSQGSGDIRLQGISNTGQLYKSQGSLGQSWGYRGKGRPCPPRPHRLVRRQSCKETQQVPCDSAGLGGVQASGAWEGTGGALVSWSFKPTDILSIVVPVCVHMYVASCAHLGEWCVHFCIYVPACVVYMCECVCDMYVCTHCVLWVHGDVYVFMNMCMCVCIHVFVLACVRVHMSTLLCACLYVGTFVWCEGRFV